MTLKMLPHLLPANYPPPLAQQYDAAASTWDQKLQYIGLNRVYERLFKALENQYLRQKMRVYRAFEVEWLSTKTNDSAQTKARE
jgi:hypothetical protein